MQRQRSARPALRAVLFDFGHTLVDFRRVPSALIAAYAEVRSRLEGYVDHELPGAEDLAHEITGAMDLIVRGSYEQGRIQELDIVDLLVDAFAGIGVALDQDLARELAVIDHRGFSESITVPAATLDVLEELASRGLAMGLVSNITLAPELLHADLRAFGLAPYLCAVAFSSEVGWRKPDGRIFAHALEQLGTTASQAAFVGDRLWDDIAGAGRAGMATVLTREFRDELEGPERLEALRIGEDALARIRPDLVISRLEELPGALDLLAGAGDPRAGNPGSGQAIPG